MANLYRDTGVVLRVQKLGEADRIITFLTQRHGKLRAVAKGVRDELPHSIAVVVEEMQPREGRDDLIDIHAFVFVERSSQKAIILGHRGERLKQVGMEARKQIERLLGSRVYLDLHIKIAKDWQRDPKQLRRLGF